MRAFKSQNISADPLDPGGTIEDINWEFDFK